jgi:hypothetical protein
MRSKVTNAWSYTSIPHAGLNFAYSYAGSYHGDAALKTSKKRVLHVSVLRQLF